LHAKKIIIIAGPNGAGKTTFAREYLPGEAGCSVFVNADLIAAGFSPFSPEAEAVRAGRLMLKESEEHAKKGKNFAFETTLAGLSHLKRIEKWLTNGYVVKLLFLSLATPEQAVDRVRLRVAQGGHNIPEATIHRRFHKGLDNFQNIYRHRADYWQLINNSGERPVLVETGEKP